MSVTASHRRRRLRHARWQRLTRIEFWPSWAMYAPIVPWMVVLGARWGSLTAFTATNPGMPTGGLTGESKWVALEALRQGAPDLTPATRWIPLGPTDERLRAARDAVEALGLPLVVKPDVGQRGRDVVIAHTLDAVQDAILALAEDALVQAFAPGVEVGLYWVHDPDTDAGRLASIGEKRPLVVSGDGERTLEALILDDPRAVCLAEGHLQRHAARLAHVPAAGEEVVLTQIGTHSKGSIFVDGEHLRTPALEAAVDRAGRAIPGFHMGRFDARSPTWDDLRAGRFRIVEVNGIGGEHVPMYDPDRSAWSVWALLARHWAEAYRIGAAMRRRGARATSLADLVRAGLGYRERAS